MPGFMQKRPVYLDYNATTPVDRRIVDAIVHYMCEEFGNSGSRTHEYGTQAKKAVEMARTHIAREVSAAENEVVFTSGATESNNLAILGLVEFGEKVGKKHIVTSAIEHKSVLEPCRHLESRGFQVSYLSPGPSGRVNPAELGAELRPDTLLVSLMHANNETGIVQPIEEVVDLLSNHDAFLHVDAAQTFCKLPGTLNSKRIDLISVSGHKVFAPKGVGALIARGDKNVRTALEPLMFGGGQEQGLRPGTVPVPLVVGLGLACELAHGNYADWFKSTSKIKKEFLSALASVPHQVLGDQHHALPNCVNVCFPNVDAEALFVNLSKSLALSNGSACTSSSYKPSYVLKAMGLDEDDISSSVRISWVTGTDPAVLQPLVETVSFLS